MDRKIQLYCIKYRINKLRKADRAKQRNIMSYSNVKQVGILFRAPTKAQAKGIDLLIRGLLDDGKSVSAFTFLDNETSPECIQPFKSFRPLDMDRWGNIKAELVNRFLDMSLDYLVCISNENLPEMEYMLLKSNACCRMGIDTFGMPELFELVFDTKDAQPEEACLAILGYLRKLQGTWQKPMYLSERP